MSGTGLPNTGTEPAPSGESSLNDTGLAEMFSPEPTPTPAPVVEGAPAAQPTPIVAPAASVPATVTAPVPAPVVPDHSAELAAMREEITRLKNPPAVGADGKPLAPPEDPLTTVPAYDFKFPDTLVQQLNHEDPAIRAQALSATVSAVAKTVHNQVLQQMSARFEQMAREIPQTTTRTLAQQEEQRAVTTDFYGKFPEYNTPFLKPLVQMALLQVGKANPDLARAGWSPALRDKLGEYLKAQIPLATQPAPVPGKKVAAVPPPMINSGARPAPTNLTGNEAALAEMFD